MTVLSEWWMPVNAWPDEVRHRLVGPTAAVEPSESTRFLPVLRLAKDLAWPNATFLKGKDAHHFTALGWPG